MPQTRYAGTYDEEWLRNGSPTGPRSQSMPILNCNADLTALSTGVMTSVAVPVQPGLLVTNISFKSGATAADTPTHWWFALYDASGALLGQTADKTNTAWAANTLKTLPLATAVRVANAGVIYAACMVTATGCPTLVGANLGLAGASASILSSSILAQTSGSSLTTTAPATIATPTAVATLALAILT